MSALLAGRQPRCAGLRWGYGTAGLALLLASAPAARAQTDASVELKAPATPVAIGAPVELEGTARYPSGATLSFDPAAQSSGAVQALEAQLAPETADGATSSRTVKLKVAAFELGMVTLPPVHWTLAGADAKTRTIDSPAVRFESVGPPNAGKDADIRDIRGPLRAPWWLWGAPLLLLAAAVGGFWWWRRRRLGPAGAAEKDIDRRRPHERALDDLNALYHLNLPVKEFYIRLTDILRVYFEARYGVPATVMTTNDMLRRLREAEMERSAVGRSREVFDHADLVKFARLVPDQEEIRRDWSEAEAVVRETAPPPPQPQAETAPAAQR